MPQHDEMFLGVDIGGTKVAAGLVNTKGEMLFKTRAPMNSTGSEEDALSSVCTAIDSVLAEASAKIRAIGVSTPGTVDLATGTVVNPYNIPCWRNYPLGQAIRERYGLRTEVHNDGNAAGLAEALWGAGASHKMVLYATIGTGIGTAIVYGGRLYLGRTHSAGEGGHMVINFQGPKCNCGKSGCIETFAAGPAIARRAQEAVQATSHEGEALLRLVEGNLGDVRSETVARAWEQGDPLATRILEETVNLLAIWFGNMIDFIEPDVIVVGGGLSGLIARWFERLGEQTARWCNNPHSREIAFAEAKYGPDSGIVGAAAVCFAGKNYIS
ncbi:MAG TPA: ROK family protein [Terriglobales bacterium]|nr:ROK family protein [Terriglobales bacterium]